ncbi:NACHT, LRR and PYD domains-containing protein 2 [Hondaea fermentalgiana]|uniref:NACHT, LRR and PYD domains-containing protein 2 n=1 Tax=Hondaea fermentalgiana TaxID=2315210 RepID=A0A2R5GSF0_9STRA|nr:NACHT, LRR and PYD domains-containing protein 2 [Hondaea fermentalgiana]|eukprot:GBG33792.1 NACHT, LRR and PYD domains-containing protein 2 [Hondaea fermentalgiana]
MAPVRGRSKHLEASEGSRSKGDLRRDGKKKTGGLTTNRTSRRIVQPEGKDEKEEKTTDTRHEPDGLAEGESKNELDADVLAELDATLPERAQDASRLNSKAVAQELELRNVKPTGFQGEDVKALQALYDEEYAEELARAKERRALVILQKQQEIEEERLRRKMEREAAEEQTALEASPRVSFWLAGIEARKCPRDAQLHDITPPLCRTLCKPLQKDNWLVSLDLSHSDVGDASGVLLAKALCANAGIQRLELEACNLGPRALRALASVLEQNKTLRHMSLENNMLTGPNGDELEGVDAFGQGLQHNITLLMLNMWRTGLGEVGGNVLASGLEQNNTLLSLGVGCSGISSATEVRISVLLDRNAARKRELDQQAFQEKQKRDREEAERKAEEDARLAAEEEERWLERRKVERATARAEKKLEEQRRIEEEKRRLEEERLAAEEAERLRLEAKKKKKGKKGKKKKK